MGGFRATRLVRFVTLSALIVCLGASAMRTASATARTASAVATSLASASRAPGALLVRIERRTAIRRWPGAGRTIGWMPAHSRYYRQPIRAWVLRTADGGRYGNVPVPYTTRHRAGWIDLRGLRRTWTGVRVAADLSEHRIVVTKRGRTVARFTAGTGSPATPTPTGNYFVTDRVAFPRSSEYGSFAFGISGIQPRLPVGWSTGDQLAIHGTNDPASIGRSVSTGCLRVSERALARLKLLLERGTPVVIRP